MPSRAITPARRHLALALLKAIGPEGTENFLWRPVSSHPHGGSRSSGPAREAHRRPVGGVWQGVDPQTKSVASVIWVSRPALEPAMVFLEIDGETMASPGRGPER